VVTRSGCAPSAPTTREFVEMVFAEVGGRPRVRAAPRWGLTVAGWFNPELRAVREQLYQFEQPWHVDSTKFEGAFGSTATPLREAIRATVEWFRAHP
jgi:nucleoside-diphosphate-sugar epimerase